MSPGELLLVVKPVDDAGHLGVEGHVGKRTYGTEVLLQFSPFTFDPLQLAPFARMARQTAGELVTRPRSR